jgi:succinate-acetate transporter protein
MRTARPRYRARGILFVAIAVGMLALAVVAAMADEWVVTVAAGAIGLWMADLARRDLGPRRG